MASVSRIELFNSGTALTASTIGDKKSIGPRAKAFVAYLSVPAINGATTLDVKIQHSPDGTNWFDVVSMTQLVGVTGSEVKYHSQFTVANLGVLPSLRGNATLAGGTQSANLRLDLYFDEDRG